jgi:hypothetical protein
MGNFFFALFEIRENTFFEIKRYGWGGGAGGITRQDPRQ